MMCGYSLRAQAFAQVPGQALGQTAGIDEYQGGAVLAGQHGQTVIHQAPDIGGHDCVQWHGRHFQGQVAGAGMADVDNGAVPAPADQKLGHPFDRALCGRQANTAQRSATQGLQTFKAEGQVAAALVAGQGMDLVNDHRVHTGQALASGVGAEQHIQ
ncbi:hypothetical protein D3C80_1083850 [compost metagenome]